MNLNVIMALTQRYLYLYTRSWIRIVELVFWPFMELLVWGTMTLFLAKQGEQLPQVVSWLIGGVIFWDVLFRAQQAVAISFLEDVWSKNLVNIFVAPVRMTEYVTAGMLIGVLRTGVTVGVLAVIAAVNYHFHLFDLKWQLIPLFGNLLIFGWILGMISSSLIMKWGQAAESLAWAVPYLIQPAAAVFYPLATMPGWAQWIGKCLPCTYVFEGMRVALAKEAFPWDLMRSAFIANVIWMLVASGIYAFVLEQCRRRGLLTKIASH
jgi:ABC-2 type transport system permease protein